MLSRGGAAESLSTTALNSAVAAEAETEAPTEIFRTDYKPLPHVVSKINMDFVIHDGKTTVTSELFIEPNKKAEGVINMDDDLVLDGDDTSVKLLSVSVDGKELEQGVDYVLKPHKMIVKSPKPGTVLKTVVEIVPEENTQLSGLYKSGPMYCSQVSSCRYFFIYFLVFSQPRGLNANTFCCSRRSVKHWDSVELRTIQTDPTIWLFSITCAWRQTRMRTLFFCRTVTW